ncbi:MAG TPA: tetratricopeptide repeat protein, partial [Myxococcaceae bacterium]|nr:tetratricopeptide repeat protein [Myxococcaceae bacterium]
MSARANQLLEAGLWLKMSGDLDGARKLFEQALKLDPDSIRARELLGHSVAESEAVPEELRDVPITRSDLFSVPLPGLFQEEAPAATTIPEEWWNAPPSDGMGNTSRFFVRPPPGSPDAPGPMSTIPWGPSPLPPREDDFQGDDLGESGDDFGLELSEGTPASLSRSGPKPVLTAPELLSPAAAATSQTTGAIPLPPELVRMSPVPGPPPGLFQEPTVVTPAPRTTGAIPLTPAPAPGVMSPVPGSLRPATTGAIPLPPAGTPPPIRPLVSPVPGPRPELPRSSGPVPLPPAASSVRSTPGGGTPWLAPAAPPRGTPTLETHGVVPLPSKGSPGALPPEPSPSLEPLPWPMPVSPPGPSATTPSRGGGPVPLPGSWAVAPPAPRVPAASAAPPAVAPFPPPPKAGLTLPSDAWGEEGEGPTVLAPEEPAAALELLAEPRTISGLTPLPVPRDPHSEAVKKLERAREL